MLAAQAKQWLIRFNPLKTEAILFTLRQFKALLNLIFDNVQLRSVGFHNHIGVTISAKGQWHTCKNIVKGTAEITRSNEKIKV